MDLWFPFNAFKAVVVFISNANGLPAKKRFGPNWYSTANSKQCEYSLNLQYFGLCCVFVCARIS